MRDWRGIPASRVIGPDGDIDPRLVRVALVEIDQYLRDASRGFGRIEQGEVPSGSGTPIASNPDLTNYLYLPGRAGGQTVLNTAAGDPVIIVKGFSGQSAALQRWVDSSGTLLASCNSVGHFFSNKYWTLGSTQFSTLIDNLLTLVGSALTYTTVADGEIFVNNGVGNSTLKLRASDVYLGLDGTGEATYASIALHPTYTLIRGAPGNSSNVTLRIRHGATGTITGDLTQWRNQADTLSLAGVASDGGIYISGTGLTANVADSARGIRLVGSPSGFYVDLAPSSGSLIVTSGANYPTLSWGGAAGPYTGLIDSGRLNLRSHTTGTPSTSLTLAVRAPVSTANTQEWQDNTGNRLAYVDRSGNITAPTITATTGFSGPAATLGTPSSSGGEDVVIGVSPGVAGAGLLLDDGSGFKGTLMTGTGLTAARSWSFPDGSGAIVIGGTQATLVGSTASVFNSSTSTSGAAFQDSATTTKKLRFVLSTAVGANAIQVNSTAARLYQTRDLSGDFVIVGNDPPAVAAGALGKVDDTAKTLAIGSTNLSSTPPAGVYRVCGVLTVTTAGGADRTIDVTIGWTDSRGAQTRTLAGGALSGAATNSVDFDYTLYVASGDISYSTTVAGAAGSAPTYELRVRVIALG